MRVRMSRKTRFWSFGIVVTVALLALFLYARGRAALRLATEIIARCDEGRREMDGIEHRWTLNHTTPTDKTRFSDSQRKTASGLMTEVFLPARHPVGGRRIHDKGILGLRRSRIGRLNEVGEIQHAITVTAISKSKWQL